MGIFALIIMFNSKKKFETSTLVKDFFFSYLNHDSFKHSTSMTVVGKSSFDISEVRINLCSSFPFF